MKRIYDGEIIRIPDVEYDARLEPSTDGKGRKRWLNAIVYPVMDDNGHVNYFVMMYEDITERKRSEE